MEGAYFSFESSYVGRAVRLEVCLIRESACSDVYQFPAPLDLHEQISTEAMGVVVERPVV
jgi:hypothetical protein